MISPGDGLDGSKAAEARNPTSDTRFAPSRPRYFRLPATTAAHVLGRAGLRHWNRLRPLSVASRILVDCRVRGIRRRQLLLHPSSNKLWPHLASRLARGGGP